MASKYDGIMKGLPDLPPADAKRQDKINVIKDELRNTEGFELTGASLALELERLDAEEERLQSELHALGLRMEAVEQLIINTKDDNDPAWGAYGAADTVIKLPSGKKVQFAREPYPSVVDKDAHREWAIREGLERSLMLPWATTKSLTIQKLQAGEEAPDGVDVFVKKRVSVHKARKTSSDSE